MNRTVKGILAGCGVLAVLGGGLAVLKLTEPEKTDDDTADVDECIDLWEIPNSEDINTVIVESEEDSYTANRKMEETEDSDSEGNVIKTTVANYYLEGYEEIPMDVLSIRTLATRSYTACAEKCLTTDAQESDLAKYGLDKPITVTFKVDDSDDISFLVGDISPDSTLSYLCKADDKKSVYLVNSTLVEPYRKPLLQYLGTAITEAQADDDETIVEDVLVERKDIDYRMHIVYDDFYQDDQNGGSSAAHILVEPVRSLLNAEKSATTTHGLYGLISSEVLIPHPTDADLTKCGLDDPFVRVTVKTDDGKTQVFRLGDTYEGKDPTNDQPVTRYYGYLDGIDCIYGFSAEDTVYEDVTPDDIASKLVIETYVWDIGRLTYKAGDLTLDFDGAGTEQKDYNVTCNGEETDNERFRLLYTYLLKTSAETILTESVDMTGVEPMAEVNLERQDGTRSYNVKFYDAGGMKAYIAVDDHVSFSCRKSYVDTLIENMKIYYDTDKEFTMTW